MKRFLAVILSLASILAFSSFAVADSETVPFTAEEIQTMIDDGTLDLNLIDFSNFYSKGTAVTIGERDISPTYLNYNYVNQYYSFMSSYGSYASYFGLDTSLGISSLAGQSCPMLSGGTWKDYFVSAAVDSIVTNTALCDYAAANGIELTEAETAAALEGFDSMEETAVSYGFETADDFLASSYGTGATVEALKEYSLEYALASKVYRQLSDGIVVTDDEVREQYPSVAVRHILVKAEAGEDGTYSDEAKETAKARAEEILSEWQAGEATEETFAALAEQYSEDAGSNTNGGLYGDVSKGQMVEEFDSFCFDGSRKPGDTGIVYGESGSYAGYHVMYFVGEGSLETGRATLLNQKMDETLASLTEPYEVSYGPLFSLAGNF